MHPSSVFLRRARIRNLKEGKVQTARAEVFENNPRDDAERWQDYGFAASPVDGEGLRIEVGGHIFILRMDRLAERPELAAHEVCVWHKDGHKITLKQDGEIRAQCTTFVIEGALQVTETVTAATVIGTEDVIAAGVSGKVHQHDVEHVPGLTSPPVAGG